MPITLEKIMKRAVRLGDCLMHSSGVVREGSSTTTMARKVWELVHGSTPGRNFVKRTCGREECINPDHLLLQELKPKSIRAKRSKTEVEKSVCKESSELLAGEVQEIRQEFRNGATVSQLAFAFKLMPATVHAILRRQIWKTLP